ncbi:branched-chain amino acid aminotransferase [Cupriavidus sp. USMAA2-4]|uniref:aminotransferase class IV family protein n=1 Tax=Cupriavidus sp. USMAA2-4 TaxID=876364 RepID=UPI0008A6A786|nr:aminotransferase class IV family protein [Cupriavidus sp. USMAA2-4]AOY95459.1 branched-chain amino acid aminotransferase [Cupriavidus sp. USMAA2-4]
MTGIVNTLSSEATAQCDGRTASSVDLAPVAFAGYAHFTALQVREGKVRGLDLHLQRLRKASLAMFGRSLADEDVRKYLRSALELKPEGNLSLTATIYSSAGEFTAAESEAPLSMLVRTSSAFNGPQGPLRLDMVDHQRMLPEIKHVGEIAKTWFLRKAVEHGFDDAAFVDAEGRLSEATIWNLAFWDGSSVLWPRAPMLRGTTMSIVMRQLERMGISQQHQDITMDSLKALHGAVVMNSWTPAVEVRSLGAIDIPSAPDFVALLHRAFAAEPLMAI